MHLPQFTKTLAFRISGLFLFMLAISGGGFWLWLSGAGISGDMAAEEAAWYESKAEGELDSLAIELSTDLSNLDILTRKTVEFGRNINRFNAEVIVFDGHGRYISSSEPDSLAVAVASVNPQLMHDMSDGNWDYGSYPLPEDVDAYENRIFEVDRLHLNNDTTQPVVGYLAASYFPAVISLEDIESAERKIGLNAIVALLLYSALCGLVIMVWTTSRIRRLNESVESFASGDLKVRVPVTSSDELGALGRNFNTMAGNIETMMDALRDKEQFQRQLIANISHDLRTPMASMRGYVETLSLQSETMNETDRDRYLSIINSNLIHLDKLIDHMLVLSRFDSGQATFQMEEFPLGELADAILMRSEGLAADRSINLELQVADIDTLVEADPLQIAQVLQNLVENGIKFNRDGGKVIIKLDKVDSELVVEVCDTGLGISKTDIPHIFKRFYTADKSRTRAVDGSGLATTQDHLGQSTGLGLAIASKIIAGHGSQLLVHSKLAEGTTFTFTLKAVGEDNAPLKSMQQEG